jgi:LuxR family maltose regulon positive regulatory protein
MSSITLLSPSTAHHDQLESPPFRVKFQAPLPPRHFVRRQRLLDLLDDLTEYPITAIVAPAGSGKTVLAADWLAHRRLPGAWLTLDAGDRDATELWSSLATALNISLPETIADSSGQLRPGEGVLDLLARMPHPNVGATPMVLVIDDLHRVDDDEAVRAVLAAFVEHRPSWLRLLLLSRRRPALPVDRLRASGELADIDFGALHFSHEEARLLLTGLCPDLRSAELSAAVDRADGWAAVLQLTALAIRSHRYAQQPPSFHRAHPGPEKLVDEYLREEVLRLERPELTRLLLSTSMVERVNYGLAEVLTQRPDAGDLLEEAEAAGLFVTALDGGWFRVHRMVRTTLTARLQRRSPESLRRHHARAAQWLENTGDGLASLDHWLSAERPADALRVLSEQALTLLEAGRAAPVLDALAQIPTEAVSADPANAIRYAWCHLAAGPRAFDDTLPVVASIIAEGPDQCRSRMHTLRAISLWLRGDWTTASVQARHALDETGGTAVSHPVDRFGWRMVSGGIALDERWDDQARAVGDARAASLSEPSGRSFFEGARAVGLALAGRPLEASRVADEAREAAGTRRHETFRIELALADALVARELDDRDAARSLLADLVATPTHPDPVLQMVAQLELVRERMSAGDLESATAELHTAEDLHAHLARSAPEMVIQTAMSSDAAPSSLVARTGVDVALASDDAATAARWASQVSDPFWGPACEAKIHLAHQRFEEAVQAARLARPRCPRHEVVSGLLLGRALATQERNAAEKAVASALDLAARHAMLRTVASEGAPVMDLIELAAWRVPDTWMDRLRRAMVVVWTGHDAQRPVDDLTEREFDVLRLLPSRLTLTEIASELYVSQNTVKFHVRAIYRKLGAVSRGEAVEAARSMRLLPRGG